MAVNAGGGVRRDSVMCASGVKVKFDPPPVHDFITLRANCGWGDLDEEVAYRALGSGIINVTLYEGDEVVGFGRVVGDGVLYFYIQDLIVKRNCRGQGLGKMLMGQLLMKITDCAPKGASVGLMSATGKENFYKQFGFKVRPSAKFGAGMTLDIT